MAVGSGDDWLSSEAEFLISLKADVAQELAIAHIDDPEQVRAVPQDQWLFDPSDLERQEIGLRSMLGAIEALERGPEPGAD
jgi:hypothetical protein